MLELDELIVLLNTTGGGKFTKEQAEKLFKCLDKDQSGSVCFADFVDFVFGVPLPQETPSSQNCRPLLMGRTDTAELKEDLLCATIAQNGAMNMLGAPADLEMNGTYDVTKPDWIINACAGTNRSEGQLLNGLPCFMLPGAPTKHLFYGWSKDGKLKGWFVAHTLPTEGLEVEEYLLFNPSPLASTPDLCCATWQTPKGLRPKSTFTEPASASAFCIDEVEAEACLDDELWYEADSDEDSLDEDDQDEAAPDEDFDWEAEWANEAGEFLDGSDSESLDSAPEGEEVSPEDAAKNAMNEHKKKLAKLKASKRRSSSVNTLQGNMEVHKVAPGFKVVRKRDQKELTEEQKSKAAAKAKKREEAEEKAAKKAEKKEKKKKELPDWDISTFEDGYALDYAFPPSRKSLGAVTVPVDGWMRLSALHDKACLFRRVSSDQVYGAAGAGNFWFLSAIAVTAEYPAWIQSMFGRTTQLSESGRYHVRLYHPGRKEFLRVTIDDYVPVYKRAPAFAGITGDGEIWPALIEKAFAKFCRSYANLEWGQNLYGMLYICGGGRALCWQRLHGQEPCESQWKRSYTVWNGLCECQIDRERAEGILIDGRCRDTDQLWLMLRRYMEFCYPVACDVDESVKDKKGLFQDRSYSLLGAREVPSDDERVLRMVFLRNPFGVGEWTGRWSKNDDAWNKNPGAGITLNPGTIGDGTFWMSYSDFLRHFDKIHVVKKAMPVQGCNSTKLVGLKRGLGLNQS